MKNTFNAILFISIFISMVSCEKPVESFDNSVLYPIYTGNYWKYKIFTYSGEKILPNLTDSLLIAIDNEIIVNLEGKTYRGGVQTRRFGKNTYAPAKWIYTNLYDGLYYLGGLAEKDTIFQKFMYLKYPVKRGETWDVPYMYYHIIKQRFEYRPDSTLVYTCLSENQKISTEIGEFNCVNYYFREKPAEDVLEYWDYFISYTPGVGLIEMDIKSALDNRMIQKIIIVEYKTK